MIKNNFWNNCLIKCYDVSITQPLEEPVAQWYSVRFTCTVKPVLSSHSKIDKTKVLKTGGSLVQVESIAECSEEHSAILLTCIILTGHFRQALL